MVMRSYKVPGPGELEKLKSWFGSGVEWTGDEFYHVAVLTERKWPLSAKNAGAEHLQVDKGWDCYTYVHSIESQEYGALEGLNTAEILNHYWLERFKPGLSSVTFCLGGQQWFNAWRVETVQGGRYGQAGRFVSVGILPGFVEMKPKAVKEAVARLLTLCGKKVSASDVKVTMHEVLQKQLMYGLVVGGKEIGKIDENNKSINVMVDEGPEDPSKRDELQQSALKAIEVVRQMDPSLEKKGAWVTFSYSTLQGEKESADATNALLAAVQKEKLGKVEVGLMARLFDAKALFQAQRLWAVKANRKGMPRLWISAAGEYEGDDGKKQKMEAKFGFHITREGVFMHVDSTAKFVHALMEEKGFEKAKPGT